MKRQKQFNKIPYWKEKVLEHLNGQGMKNAVIIRLRSMFKDSGPLFILREPGNEYGKVFSSQKLAHEDYLENWKQKGGAGVSAEVVS